MNTRITIIIEATDGVQRFPQAAVDITAQGEMALADAHRIALKALDYITTAMTHIKEECPMTASANVSTVRLTDGREVCLSYGVPVAAFIPGRGYIKTDRKYSVTTSRHANQYAGGSVTVVSHVDFCKLVEPITSGR